MTAKSPSVIDREAALARLGNDIELYNEVLTIFLEYFPQQHRELTAAIVGEQRDEIRRIAHSLKSSCGNVGAERARDVAKVIEDAADSGAIDSLLALASELDSEFTQFKTAAR